MTIAELLESKVLAEGRAEGVASSVPMVLAARKLHVSDEARRRIEGCTDVETLDHWLVSAATAASVDDVFED